MSCFIHDIFFINTRMQNVPKIVNSRKLCYIKINHWTFYDKNRKQQHEMLLYVTKFLTGDRCRLQEYSTFIENVEFSGKTSESIVRPANSSGWNISVSRHSIARYIQCANTLRGLPRFYESIPLHCGSVSCSGKR